ALVQCGYLSNSDDAAFIKNSADQEKIAQNILDAINLYGSSKNTNDGKSAVNINEAAPYKSAIKDTIPKSKKATQVNVISINGMDKINMKEDAKVVAIKEGESIPPPLIMVIEEHASIPANALLIANGKEISNKGMKNISPNNIQSINVLKDKKAIDKYGEKGKNGVIEIITKNNNSNIKEVTGTNNYSTLKKVVSVPDKVFTKVENEASFPGGQQAWVKYISKAIQDSLDKFTKSDYGTCVIRFIVNVDGTVSDVVAPTMKGTELAKVSIKAIENGPKWIPASQNGKTVASYRLQPVTLSNPGNKQVTIKFLPPKVVRDSGNVYVNPDGLARFPGGQSAWLKYISMIINKHGNQLNANKNNIGTCKVKFVVNTKGKVSEVHATTMEGTELAEVVMNAIKDGPNWMPGKQNGQVVNSFVIQPVTFKLSDHIMNRNEPE
ncbi:MAG: energy transducer TonB, partial [Ginsengibacter sp.]